MKRLTGRDKEGVAFWNGANGKSFSDNKGNVYGEAITKLAEYEDAEEDGLLVGLPCKKVWFVCDKGTKYATVMSRDVDGLCLYEIDRIDKERYWTSEEKALEEMKENEK